MGLVKEQTRLSIKPWSKETIRWPWALLTPGRRDVEVSLADMSADEVEQIVLKLDQLALDTGHYGVAKMIAEEFRSIFMLIRRVKDEAKGSFEGILGAGSTLDMIWLRPKDVGGTLLNSAGTASKGLYGGTSGGVFTWLNTFTANTAVDLVPSQRMTDKAGLIYLGFLDNTAIPKVNTFEPTLAGMASHAQSLALQNRQSGGLYQTPFARLEMPIVVTPRQIQQIQVMPNISGDSRLEPVALLVAEAQNLNL